MQQKEKIIPVLRFSEFKGSWQEKPFSSLGEFKGGGTPDTKNETYWNGDIPWVSSSDLYEDDIRNINITRFINKTAIAESATKLIPSNSILMVSRVGVGKFAVSTRELCTSQDFSNLIPKNDDAFYISYWLSANKEKLIGVSQGTSIKGFTTSDLKALKIKIPKPKEQQKIAAFLGAVDEKVCQLQKKKGLLEDYKKGCMQKLFSQETRFTDNKGKSFPDWKEKKLGDVLTIGSGRDYKHLADGDIPVYGTGGYMTSVNAWLYDGESVCIGRKGTIDQPRFLTGKFWTVDTLFFTHSFNRAIPKFIYYVFLSIDWQKYNEASGVPSLSKKTIEQIKTMMPHPDEQKKIADFLSAIDSKISLVSEEIDKAKTFKKGLLQQMFA